jgi:pimeloyl-ACP methyl ester carboxylesterase
VAALDAGYREQALLLGPRRSLLTICTVPTAVPAGDAPAVLILNTGIVHRTGHNRMYVSLARRLARRGRLAVRFDFSGVGDSVARGDGTPPLEAWMQDIRTVLDCLQQTHGVRQVVLTGLCYGADHAVLYGATDPRVVGLVLMDPSLPPTPRYYYHYILQRFGHLSSWLSVLRGRSGLLRAMAHHRRQRRIRHDDLRGQSLDELLLSPYLRECYMRVAKRGTRLLTVFTAVSARHTYHDQMLDAFPEVATSGSLRLEYFPEGDHLFSAPDMRERLYRVIIDWLGLD